MGLLVGSISIGAGWTRPSAPVAPDIPSAPVVQVVTAGRPTTCASAAWGSTVVHATQAGSSVDEMLDGIRTSMACDPAFMLPAAYGARLLLVLGHRDESHALLEVAVRQWPEERWFAWMLGMQYLVEENDPERAAPWLERARP